MRISEGRSVALTMAVTFSLVFAYQWSQRRRTELPSVARALPPPAPVFRAPATAPLQAPLPSVAAVPESLSSPKRPQGVPASPSEDIPPKNYDGPEMPLVFAAVPNTVYVKEEDADGTTRHVNKEVNEGIVMNESDKSFNITAVEVNFATMETSTAGFLLAKGAQKHFGIDDGLKMQSGDQLTLRSAGYRDMTRTIP
jgi:hypothetical protein